MSVFTLKCYSIAYVLCNTSNNYIFTSPVAVLALLLVSEAPHLVVAHYYDMVYIYIYSASLLPYSTCVMHTCCVGAVMHYTIL